MGQNTSLTEEQETLKCKLCLCVTSLLDDVFGSEMHPMAPQIKVSKLLHLRTQLVGSNT